MSLITVPSTWNSAHRPIVYVLKPAYYFNSAGSDSGNLELKISPASNLANFIVGSSVIINSPSFYAGTYKILSITGTGIVLNVAYVGNDSGGVASTRVPVALWAGYDAAHVGYSDYPYQKIADLTAIRNASTGFCNIDVSGYIKSVLKEVKTPRIGKDFQMSVPFNIVIAGELATTYYALNGTLTQNDLSVYDAAGKILNAREPIHFKNGKTIYSMIWPDTAEFGEHIVNIVATQGTGSVGGVGFDQIGTTFIIQ